MKLPPTIDRYEVIDRLGRGGMGIVYRARDPRLGRTVAIKVLATDDDSFRERFVQEARLAATLHHKNIVTVFDYGEQETGPFIVMEYIEGATIADHLQRGHPLSLDRKLELLYDLATALDYAHNHGIVHRDIKPSNLMIDRDGLLKILDFGVARLSESQLTQVGAMIGTPSYMAPEQIDGQPTDRRTDVFAVGVTAYELLSSQKAFPDQISIRAILLEDPVPLHTLCPELDPTIERIVKKAIRKEPSRRYATLAVMATDLKRALERHRSLPDDESTRPVATLARAHRKSHSTVPAALERARHAFSEGRYQSAIAAAAEVLESQPDNPQALELTRQAFEAFERNRASIQRETGVVSDGKGEQQPPQRSSRAPRRNAAPVAVAVAVAVAVLMAATIGGTYWLKSYRSFGRVNDVARSSVPGTPPVANVVQPKNNASAQPKAVAAAPTPEPQPSASTNRTVANIEPESRGRASSANLPQGRSEKSETAGRGGRSTSSDTTSASDRQARSRDLSGKVAHDEVLPEASTAATPTAPGILDDTAWLSPEQYQMAFESRTKRHFFPVRVEGRNNQGRTEFRAAWQESSPQCQFSAYHGLTAQTFEQFASRYKADGFGLVSGSQFVDAGGIRRFQATWTKNCSN